MAFEMMELSASTGGRGTKITGSTTPGTTLHTTGANATDLDLVTLYACNTQTAAVKLTVEWGGTTSPDDLIEVWVPGESGLMQITKKRPLRGAAGTAKIIKAFAGTANVVVITGEVIRITP